MDQRIQSHFIEADIGVSFGAVDMQKCRRTAHGGPVWHVEQVPQQCKKRAHKPTRVGAGEARRLRARLDTKRPQRAWRGAISGEIAPKEKEPAKAACPDCSHRLILSPGYTLTVELQPPFMVVESGDKGLVRFDTLALAGACVVAAVSCRATSGQSHTSENMFYRDTIRLSEDNIPRQVDSSKTFAFNGPKCVNGEATYCYDANALRKRR